MAKKISSVVEKLLKDKEVTTVKISVTVDKKFKEKCDYICNYFDIKSDEYLGELLEKSEVAKVYSKLISESKNDAKNDNSDDLVSSDVDKNNSYTGV